MIDAQKRANLIIKWLTYITYRTTKLSRFKMNDKKKNPVPIILAVVGEGTIIRENIYPG